MYLGVYLDEDHSYSLTYSFFFLLRRFIFVMFTFLLFDHPALQLQAFIWSSILYMGYLSAERIYEDDFTFKLEYLNECLLMLMCYHQIGFTNIVKDPD